MQLATFAGGCFWCTEAAFKQFEGVVRVTSGYTGGLVKNPTYEQVCSGTTGHFEAIQMEYDENKVSYEKLLARFWETIDPMDAGGQYQDRGSPYKTAIFYHNEEQKKLAEKTKPKGSATLILPANVFYPAEDYHQDFARRNPLRYKMYKMGREN